MRLTFFHTNDLHGRAEELACLTTVARRLRAEVAAGGGHSLLVDCGDAEERTVLEMAVTKGSAAAAYLRAAGYDAMCVGNGAALSFGPQVLSTMAETAGFPLLAANLLDQEGDLLPGCTPWLIREIEGVRVALIGLAPHMPFWSLFGLQNPAPAPIITELVAQLRANGATVIVLLSHLGLVEDLQLVGQVRDIDLILGAHSHTTIFGGLIQGPGKTLIAQAGDYGRYLGRVDLEIDDRSGRVRDRQASLIPLDMTVGPDQALLDAIEQQQAIVARLLQEPVGELTQVLQFDPIKESPATNLLADALRARTTADVAICQPTHLLANLPAGVVTLRRLFRACKSPGNPAWRTLTGAQLLEMMEVGLDKVRAVRIPPWGRGRPNGLLAVSGLTARYDASAPAGQRLSEVKIGDSPLDLEKRYAVAGSDAEMTGLAWQGEEGQAQLSFAMGNEDVTFEMPTTVREVLEDYFRQNSPVLPPAVGRIQTA